MSNQRESVDVLVIGAGWSGLYAAKYAKCAGASVRVLEARSDMGGVWNYTERNETITVMRSTISSSSRRVTEASDFAMKEEAGNFFHHTDALNYLRDYSTHFGLNDLIDYDSTVVDARKDSHGNWEVETEQGERYRSKHLVVCAGVHQKRRAITQPILDFTGKTYHSGDIKHFDDIQLTCSDHVVVYGGGETASDLIQELAQYPCRVSWAIRDGQHFFRKTPFRASAKPGEYDRHDSALDEQTTFMHSLFTSLKKSKPGMRYACNLASTGSVFAYQGHGVKEWMNEIPWYHQFFNKNGFALDHVWNGRVTPYPGIVSCSGPEVRFEDGRTIEATHIICCFGYEPKFDFLPAELLDTPTHLLYKLIFHPDDPTLAFIGFARPTILSLPMMAETQCFYAARVWSNRLRLPSRDDMLASIRAEDSARDEYFLGQRSNKNIVDPFFYVYDLAEDMGITRFQRPFTRDLRLLGALMGTPVSPLLVRIAVGEFGDAEIDRVRANAFPYVFKPDDVVGDRASALVLQAPRRSTSSLLYFFSLLVRIGIPRLLMLDTVFDWIARRRMEKTGRSIPANRGA